VAMDGAVRWQRDLGAGVSGQPIATQTQLLVPTKKGLAVLERSDGRPDPRFQFQSQLQGPPLDQKVLSVLKWRDRLFMNVGYAYTNSDWPPRTYMEAANKVFVWVPESASPAADTPK
jgi:hypothetical protein